MGDDRLACFPSLREQLIMRTTRSMPRWSTSVFAVCAVVSASAGCAGGAATDVVNPVVPRASVAVVEVTPSTAGPLAPGGTTTLVATVKDTKGQTVTDRVVTWTSSAAAIAAVSTSGVVTAVSPGVATITATAEGVNGSAVVTVRVPVSRVEVTPASASLLTGATVTLAASPQDANGVVLGGRAVLWASATPAVATVSAAGVVTAVGIGSAVVTATAEGIAGSAPVICTFVRMSLRTPGLAPTI